MRRIPIFQVDAFSDSVFRGNPAAVCPLESWLPERVLHDIAAENNLSETAFFVPKGPDFALRWFTPRVEVELCGHATLATAHVILERLQPERSSVRFHTRSGVLSVERKDGLLQMDLPSQPAGGCIAPPGLKDALGMPPVELYRGAHYYLAVYETEAHVRELAPDLAALERIDDRGYIVTAPGVEADFVSRMFAPAVGVPEDPVCGSAHCLLAPYWGERLGKRRLLAHQVSQRGGVLHCELSGDRLLLAGSAALYLEGEIIVPA